MNDDQKCIIVIISILVFLITIISIGMNLEPKTEKRIGRFSNKHTPAQIKEVCGE